MPQKAPSHSEGFSPWVLHQQGPDEVDGGRGDAVEHVLGVVHADLGDVEEGLLLVVSHERGLARQHDVSQDSDAPGSHGGKRRKTINEIIPNGSVLVAHRVESCVPLRPSPYRRDPGSIPARVPLLYVLPSISHTFLCIPLFHNNVKNRPYILRTDTWSRGRETGKGEEN